MGCEEYIFGICFVTPSSGLESSIFGFSEFISALALLVIVYTVVDVRYRFRVAIAPIPLFRLTFFLIGIIGFGLLLTDIWLAEHWLVPESFITQSMWRGMFGAFFLAIAMTWIYYAFINPPIFCEKNYKKFAGALYGVILRGSDTELPVIANELARSAKNLVNFSRINPSRGQKDTNTKAKEQKHKPGVDDYAYDVLLLLGNRKLCRHIIASSPLTAIEFFKAIATTKKYNIPIGQFAKNISTEAIINRDSILYHEDDGYSSGLIGYLKPFCQSIYGNYLLVENLDSSYGSPLDIHYEIVRSWDASQLEAYSRAVLMTLKNYIESDYGDQHSFSLSRALEHIKNSCSDVYKLNEIPLDYYSTDIFKRLSVAVEVAKKAINLIGDRDLHIEKSRRHEGWTRSDFYDHIVDLIFNIILYASSIEAPPDKNWAINYTAVWGEFFGLPRDGKAWKIIHFKLRRFLYNEILALEKIPNYKSSRILGFCLNVMGLKTMNRGGYGNNYHALHKAVLTWTKKNYLHLKNIHPEVAESCLVGGLSFDEQGSRLVRTYAKGLNLEAPKEYLELNVESDSA